MKNQKNNKTGNEEINLSASQHEIKEKDLLTKEELKELFDWFDGKILRSDEY